MLRDYALQYHIIERRLTSSCRFTNTGLGHSTSWRILKWHHWLKKNGFARQDVKTVPPRQKCLSPPTMVVKMRQEGLQGMMITPSTLPLAKISIVKNMQFFYVIKTFCSVQNRLVYTVKWLYIIMYFNNAYRTLDANYTPKFIKFMKHGFCDILWYVFDMLWKNWTVQSSY